MNKRKKTTETETSPRSGLNEVERILTFNDPYDILGIPRNSSQDKIKTAYHKLIKKYDPSFDSSNRIKEEKEILEKIAVKLHLAWERLNGK
jgi:preprotein translocase subunit Sec63